MKRKSWMIAGGALVALVLVGALSAVAVHAQTPTPPTAPAATTLTDGRGPHGPRDLSQAELDAAAKVLGITADDLSAKLKSGSTLDQVASAKGVDMQTLMDALQVVRPLHLGTNELDAAAKALGMSSTDLSTALNSGKTLAAIASEKGVDVQKVQDAIQAARQAEMKQQITDAVTAGTMTQAKADWLLEGLSNGYLDGPDGFGFGHGLGFGRGPGGPGGQAGQQPGASATATP